MGAKGFKLGGNGLIPDPDLPPVDTTPKGEPFGDEETLQAGLVHYARVCTLCHGPMAGSSGVLPDLRWSIYAADAEAWEGVVIDGNLAANGMASFADQLTSEEAEAIRAYVLNQAYQAAEASGETP